MVELSWRGQMDGAEVAEVTAVLDAATEADGLSPVSEHVLLHLRRADAVRDDRSVHLLARQGQHLVGYAHLDMTDKVGGATGELVVHPDHRRRGVAAELVLALQDRVAAASGTVAASSGRPGAAPHDEAAGQLRLWAHGEHPAAVKLAEHFGYTRARVLHQMRRSLLAPLDKPVLPDGVRLRSFVVGADEEEFVEVNNRAFDWHPEQGSWDVEQVRIREAEPWFDPEGFLLAVDEDGRLLGFHWTKIHGDGARPAHDSIGEVYVLGVDPAAHGRGLGVALTLAGLHYLRGKGLREVMLYVEADNEPAVAMYRKLGFTHWDTDVAYLR